MKVLFVVLAVVGIAGCSLFGFGGDSEVERLQRIAIIPFAYQAADGGRPCDLCPEPVSMAPTSQESAVLATGFFFEQLTQYPSFIVSDPRRIDAVMKVSMVDGLELFTAMDDVDFVLVGALLEMRERQGTAFNPSSPAGVSIYAALLDARSGEQLWSGTFDQNERRAGRIRGTYHRLVNGGQQRWSDALEYIQVGARKLVKSMAKSVAAS